MFFLNKPNWILLSSTKEKNLGHGRMIPFFKAIETGTGDFCSSPYLGMSNKIKSTVADLSKHNRGNGTRGFVYDAYELIRERGGHHFYLMR
jgi:hypothetical protein